MVNVAAARSRRSWTVHWDEYKIVIASTLINKMELKNTVLVSNQSKLSAM